MPLLHLLASQVSLAALLAQNVPPISPRSTPPPKAAFLLPETRFQSVAPLPTLPSVELDVLGNGVGIAQQTARSQRLQGRVLWIDGTANLDRVSSDEKIKALVAKIKEVGFNTIVFDVKPIVGFTLYPSKLTPKLTEWRDQKLPQSFDPLASMVRETKKVGLTLFASMNVFSEGHKLTRQGFGYVNPDLQTVQYESVPVVRSTIPTVTVMPVQPQVNPSSLSANELSVFTDPAKLDLMRTQIAQFVSVDASGKVIEHKLYPMAIPAGGSVLVGPDSLLKGIAVPNDRLYFESRPRFVRISANHTQWPLMMNPHHPINQQRALSFVKEILKNYAVDGIIFDDRLRFGGMNTDFSPFTRGEFERAVGRKLVWPDDIYTDTYTPTLQKGMHPGKYWSTWLAWRSLTLSQWVSKARKVVQAVRPKAQLGVYAGSWFGDYERYGSNYGSPKLNAGFSFMTEQYRRTGFAGQLDLLITGCYYKVPTITEALAKALAPGRTVESAGQLSNRVARDQCWTYAGLLLSDFDGEPERLERALQAACGSTQGVMIFDLSHNIDQFWETFRRAFSQPANPPTAVRGLLAVVRQRRAALDKMGAKEPVVFIRGGQPGAGF